MFEHLLCLRMSNRQRLFVAVCGVSWQGGGGWVPIEERAAMVEVGDERQLAKLNQLLRRSTAARHPLLAAAPPRRPPPLLFGRRPLACLQCWRRDESSGSSRHAFWRQLNRFAWLTVCVAAAGGLRPVWRQ